MKAYIRFCLLAATLMSIAAGCTQQADNHNDGHGDELSHDGHDTEVAHDDHDHDHDHDAAPEADSEITMSPESAARFGVVSDTIHKGDFSEVIHVTGQIIDNPGSVSVVSAPTAGIVRFAPGIELGKSIGAGTALATVAGAGMSGGDSNAAGLAALNAAKRELDRVTPLHQEGIVSLKDYNAAKEAYEIAKSQYSPAAASGVAKSVSSGVVTELLVSNGQYVEAGAPIATVSANKRMTLRADVPDRYINSVPLVRSAHVKFPYADDVLDLSTVGGKVLGNSAGNAATRVAPGYVPLYFSFDNNGRVVPRTIADVYLLAAPRYGVVAVPVDALVEQQGHHFVFVQLDEECYEKVPVTLGASDGLRVEVTSGLAGGERVVVKGATAVKLAESRTVVPEGHSHSH